MVIRGAKPTVLLHHYAPDMDTFCTGVADQCEELGWQVVNQASLAGFVPTDPLPIGAVVSLGPADPIAVRLSSFGIPMVHRFSAPIEDEPHLPTITADKRAAGRMAAEHFAERQFKELGYIGYEGLPNARDLVAGFREYAGRSGCTIHMQLMDRRPTPEDPFADSGHYVHRIADWLKALPRPSGILAHSAYMGCRIIAACWIAKIMVPEEIAVICTDNYPHLCRTAPVDLSAVDMNVPEQGRQAVILLERIVRGKALKKPLIKVPPMGIVARRSTDILAVRNPLVAKAIRHMWDHVDSQLGVDDVADAMATSRSSLERAFRRCLGRGVAGELRRKRLELCRELLRGTKMKVGEISEAVGFRDQKYLHRAFRKAHGMTPVQYRTQK